MIILGLAAFAAFLYFLAVAPREVIQLGLVVLWAAMAAGALLSIGWAIMR